MADLLHDRAHDLDLKAAAGVRSARWVTEQNLSGPAAVEATVHALAEHLHRRLGGSGWKNLADRDRNPIPFTRDGVRHLIAHACTIDVAQRLIRGAQEAVRFDDARLGNSPSPWASPAVTTAPAACVSSPTAPEAPPPTERPRQPPEPATRRARDRLGVPRRRLARIARRDALPGLRRPAHAPRHLRSLPRLGPAAHPHLPAGVCRRRASRTARPPRRGRPPRLPGGREDQTPFFLDALAAFESLRIPDDD